MEDVYVEADDDVAANPPNQDTVGGGGGGGSSTRDLEDSVELFASRSASANTEEKPELEVKEGSVRNRFKRAAISLSRSLPRGEAASAMFLGREHSPGCCNGFSSEEDDATDPSVRKLDPENGAALVDEDLSLEILVAEESSLLFTFSVLFLLPEVGEVRSPALVSLARFAVALGSARGCACAITAGPNVAKEGASRVGRGNVRSSSGISNAVENACANGDGAGMRRVAPATAKEFEPLEI